jgi:hypothetical protein
MSIIRCSAGVLPLTAFPSPVAGAAADLVDQWTIN